MSIKALGWAWEQTGLNPSQKLILLCLANYANADHIAYPSKLTIARDTGLSHASVKRVIKTLGQYIEPVGTVLNGKTADGKTRETVRYFLKVEASTGVTVNRVHHEPGSFEHSTGFTMNPKPKDNLSIYVYKPASIEIDLPPEITLEQFNQFIQHRLELKKLKKKPLNQRVAKLAINEMLKLVRQGQDLSACLNQMEMKGWDQPYPVKKEQRGGGNEKRQSDRKRTDREILEDERRKFEERRRAKAAGVDDDGIIQGEFHRC